jgi:hypothetical protein
LQREAIYQHFPGYLGAGKTQWRTTPVGTIEAGDWKLMQFFEDGRLELYNLKDDIGEQKNLAKQLPDKVHELETKMLAWREGIKAPMPTKNDPAKAAAESKRPSRTMSAAERRGLDDDDSDADFLALSAHAPRRD